MSTLKKNHDEIIGTSSFGIAHRPASSVQIDLEIGFRHPEHGCGLFSRIIKNVTQEQGRPLCRCKRFECEQECDRHAFAQVVAGSVRLTVFGSLLCKLQISCGNW